MGAKAVALHLEQMSFFRYHPKFQKLVCTCTSQSGNSKISTSRAIDGTWQCELAKY